MLDNDSLDQFPKWKRVLDIQKIRPSETLARPVGEQAIACVKEAQALFGNHYRYIPDTRDEWKPPAIFNMDGGGDCEDFAIAKLYHLIEVAGFNVEDVELCLGYTKQRVFHCVVEAEVHFMGVPTHNMSVRYRLDNLHDFAIEDKLHNKYFTPLFYLSIEGWRLA